MRAPDFWRREGLATQLLTPLGLAYGYAVRTRMVAKRPARVAAPVICVGNLVAGGAGKTPVALAIGRMLAARGRAPHFLTRGYGGRLAGPVRIAPDLHASCDVGDEALLLARVAPTWVARERPAGALAALAAGAGSIVMDDGFQNPSLAKDLALVVIDGTYGFGNGRVMPAGPLREPLGQGLARADAAILIGADRAGVERALPEGLRRLRARLVPAAGQDDIADRDVVAFAGIGRPEKFFATLGEMRCRIVAAHAFADHMPYRRDDIMRLVDEAAAHHALLVTTAKDAVRLPAEARAMVRVVEVAIEWEDEVGLGTLLDAKFVRAAPLAANE
jgi:tetraacyldisaccharide 4'-kinase